MDPKRPETEQTQDFTRAVLQDLRALRRLIEEDRIERDVRRVGAEQEVVLVDRQRRVAPIAMELLEELGTPPFSTELARFNLEINIPPITVGPTTLSELEEELDRHLGVLRERAQSHDADVVLTGILPCLTKSDLGLDNMTPADRYRRLNEATMSLAAGRILLNIVGIDELRVEHDSVMMEACNTSFQVHLQVAAESFPRQYNAAQVALGPVLAVAANSPFLFGKRLWAETRIAVFGQSIDSRTASPPLRELTPRVRFGEGWVEESVIELFEDDVLRFRPMVVTGDWVSDSMAVLDRGEIPELKALQIHNSTVYRWNRPCYGITDGKPHLRIECRALPSGPTVADQVANAAFWLGLTTGLVERHGDVSSLMPFEDAKSNFLAAARRGLHTSMLWLDGKDYSVPKLVLDRLLPLAREGLETLGVRDQDADRYLGLIRDRAASGQTGTRWLERSAGSMSARSSSRPERCAALTAAMIDRQLSGEPVHRWKLARLEEGRGTTGPTVDQYMTSDLCTVQQDEHVDLAAFMMDREHTRHILVEDEQFRLVGLVSYRALLRLLAGGAIHSSAAVPIRDVMAADPITVPPATPVIEAIRLMRKHEVSCLPVVEEGRLVGLISEREFMPLASELISQLFNDG